MKKPVTLFTSKVEPSALDQFYSAMKQEFSVKGALMPDAHTGYTLPIGGVIATKDFILPSWVGYDIGCGLCALPTNFSAGDIRKNADSIYRQIYLNIPTGFNNNKRDSDWEYRSFPCSETVTRLFEKNGLKQLGSLGSGNHFIEIGEDETNKVWIIIHSGSRNLGHSVATHYMKLASKDGKAREGHFGFRTDSDKGEDYINDMSFCLAFALENRRQMINRILDILHSELPHSKRTKNSDDQLINRTHNHVEFKEGLWIHRKGATHAEEGMLGVIPGNMRDGSFIVEGKGNPESLWSSSHGAGRVMGRRQAKKKLSLKEFKATMKGIKSKATLQTIDESPFAYKDIFEIMDLQKNLVRVLHRVKPIINIKG